MPVKILRDTGSVESFVYESVLSSESDKGDSIIICGMFIFPVPVHTLQLDSDPVKGKVGVPSSTS